MIVLDASAAVELVWHSPAGARIAVRINEERSVHAPHLLDLEVTSALRRQCALGSLTPERANEALFDYAELRIERHSHLAHLGRIWELRHRFTAYDAVYLALAEALDAVLLTRDAALRSAPLHRGRVEVV